jgi:hypothetical protein
VPGGEARSLLRSHDEPGVTHAEGAEDVLVKIHIERLAADALQECDVVFNDETIDDLSRRLLLVDGTSYAAMKGEGICPRSLW